MAAWGRERMSAKCCRKNCFMLRPDVRQNAQLAGRLLLKPGDRVCVENPGYPGAVLSFQAFGAKIVGVGVDSEGAKVDQLPVQAVRLIYITPGHQFPLGTTMTLSRRLRLLEWARKSGAVIFEDDYDSEYRYSGRPIPALQGLDENGVVVYAGSFSKVLFPALRFGYMVVPPRFNGLLRSHPVTHYSPHAAVGATCAHRVHDRRTFRAPCAAHARGLCRAPFRPFGRGPPKTRRFTGDLKRRSGLQTAGWLCGGISAESAAVAAAKRNVDETPVSCAASREAAAKALQRTSFTRDLARSLMQGDFG
jgi:GntR family transcriptional regulator / MocR family aminotransferase